MNIFKRLAWPICACLILIALSACGDASETNPPARAEGGMSETNGPSGLPNESPGTEETGHSGNMDGNRSDGVPGGDHHSSSQDEPEIDEPEMEEPDAPEITHYMTANYIFKPIDPDGDDKVVLLTFDDGPKDEDMVGSMLSVLDKHGAKAIFFVNGYRVKAKPELLVHIYENGHAIGNHSWDHIILSKQSEEEVHRQIDEVQRIVEELTGERPRFFRPPHGAGNDIVKQKAKDEGMLYMTWSNGSLDWEKGYQTPESVVEQVLKQLHPGSNILMHELPWTVEALDTLLTELANAGYSFLDPRAIRID